MTGSPFKFLDSYTREDREIFFGRDREIGEMYQKVFEGKILLVYGISGTGKTSLINCGLANKFQESDWLPVTVRRGRDILESLVGELKKHSITPPSSAPRPLPPGGDKSTVRSSVHRSSTKEDQQSAEKELIPKQTVKSLQSLYLDHFKPIYLIFDQFEELFIFGDREEREQFIRVIRAIVESDLQCKFIFSIREEYLASVTEFELTITDFLANRMRVEKMTRQHAVEVIEGPCRVHGIKLEEGFAETLLEKLSPGESDVELTYLQVFLDKIFRLATKNDDAPQSGSNDSKQSAPSSISFTLPLLEQIGNVSDLLGDFLDDQIALMEDPDSAMTVLKAFVSGKGTKRPVSEQEAVDNIRSFGKEISTEKVKELVQSFVKLRLLRDKDDNGRYELRHDALAEKIFEKFSTAEKELLEIRQFIENSYQSYQKRSILLNNDDLIYISGKDSQLNLSTELKEFLHRSRQYQKARKRTVIRLTIISAVAFVLLLLTIVYKLIISLSISESILLSKESVNQFTRPIDRLGLASYAWKISQTIESEEALLTSFNDLIRNPGNDTDFLNLRKKYLMEFNSVSSSIESAECSEDNRFIYGNTADSIYVWNKDGHLVSGFTSGDSPLIEVIMSKDGEFIGAVNADSLLSVWERSGKIRFTRRMGFASLNKDQMFRFSDNNRIVAISPGEGADLLDISGNLLQSFPYSGKVNTVDITDDGRFLAFAGMDSLIVVWYFNTDNQKFDLYNTLHLNADTIWSIDFLKNGKYIVSTSSDGKICFTSINDHIVKLIRNEYEGDYRNKIYIGYPFFAEFDDSGSGIAIRAGEQRDDWQNSYMRAIFVDKDYHVAQAGQINKFDQVSFSPGRKYLLVCSGNEISLLSRSLYGKSVHHLVNNYKLIQVTGERPFFSADGKYFYTICDKHLESYFIDVETVSAIAQDLNDKWLKFIY